MARAIVATERSPLDPRVQRTRTALLAAFNRLFLDQGYAAMTPARIAAAAGVGRSTFYEHHAGKEALLRHSVTPLLRPIAEASVGHDAPMLVATLRHFWDRRRLARRLLGGRTGAILRDQLALLVEEALAADRVARPVPVRLVAIGVAAWQLALIEAWLTGRHGCSVEQVAEAIRDGHAGRDGVRC